MDKLKALYLLNNRDLIYGPEQQHSLQAMVEFVGPPETAESIEQNMACLEDVDLILSGWGAPKLDAQFLAHCPNLQAFFYGAGTVRSFVTDAFWTQEILLTSAYAANAVPVSEYTLSTILLSLKRFWPLQKSIKEQGTYPSQTERNKIVGAFGTTVGLVSLGMIGRLVCERLRPFDMQVIAYDPFATQSDADNLGVTLVPLEELFAQADVVSVHTPWLPETVGLIMGTLIGSMKPNSTFINTSRGAIVREDELIATLEARPDLWAILDVTWPEPPEHGSPLYSLPNLIITPHIAGSLTQECRRMGQYMVEELARYLAGDPLKWEITEEKARIMA
ncbi:MAG: hydroxyacid dehydrogenase [Chloroflexota bacterium]